MDLLMQVSYKVKALSLPGYNLAAASALINGELDELEFDGHGIPDFPETHQDSPDTVFPEWWLDTFPSVSTVPIATTYLQNRGLTLAVMRALDIRYDPAQHRVAFPFRNSKRELVGLQGRVIDNSHPLRYFQYGFHGKRNMQHWMGEDFVDMDKPVVLLEGPFDLASVFRVYQNVAASFTSGLSMEKVKRFMDADSIITLYDHGSGGDSARKRIQEVLGTRPIAHIIPTPQEGDAGNMDQDTVARYLQDHVRLRYFG
jgi:5S rRNA maturation endonuclease (ribonuclease M5)